MKERVSLPDGMEDVSWDRQGRFRPYWPDHTNAHSGLHLSARDFARIGYLLAHDGPVARHVFADRPSIVDSNGNTKLPKVEPVMGVIPFGFHFYPRRRALALRSPQKMPSHQGIGYGCNRCLHRSLAWIWWWGECRRCDLQIGEESLIR